ncbi:hypothetical protein PG987_011558 [Apiospora arundinis]
MIVNGASASPNLVPVMLHFAAVLGPVWSLVLFTQEEHWKMPHSPAFVRAVQRGQIEIRFLPPATEVTTSQHMSDFLTRPWIWDQVSSAHRVLLFQLDTIICSNSLYTVEAFFDGGLSLRNPKLLAAIAKEVDFRQSAEDSEDLWFYAEAVKRGAVLPIQRVAQEFSVGPIYHAKPLGYHQPQRWQHERMKEILDWCPEVGMLVGHHAA